MSKDLRTDQVGSISMRPVDYGNGTWGVEVTVAGLNSEEEAETAMIFIQSMLCGAEIHEGTH